MLRNHLIVTANQKVLSLLAKFSDKEFYERDVARRLGIAFGSANRSLNGLYSTKAIKRRREGKMYFYSIETAEPAITEFKKLVNLMLLEPLIEDLKSLSARVILYGSCAKGTDSSQSDFDLFVVTNNKDKSADVIGNFIMPRGYEGLIIQPVLKTPVELLEAGDSEKAFIQEVEQGMVLFERAASESRL